MRYFIFLTIITAVQGWADLRKDIEFSHPGAVSLKLDAYVPDGQGPFPAAILVHGGAFSKGDKRTNVKPLFPVLSEANYAWFTIDYRLAPQHRFPAQIEDVENAVRWVKAHAKEYRVDVNRIALIGESAGGHLVAFTAAKADPSARVNAVVSFYGRLDLILQAKKDGEVGEPQRDLLGLSAELSESNFERLRAASPITFVKPGLPPFFLPHGLADTRVPYQHSVRMCEALKQAGNNCEVYLIKGAGHGFTSWERDASLQGYQAKLIEWLNQMFELPPESGKR